MEVSCTLEASWTTAEASINLYPLYRLTLDILNHLPIADRMRPHRSLEARAAVRDDDGTFHNWLRKILWFHKF